MFLPLRSLQNPKANQLHLPLAQLLTELRFGHAHGIIGGRDPPEQLTLLRLAGHNHLVAAAVGEGALFGVQAQLGLPLVLVGAVAGEAVIGGDWANGAGELNWVLVW